MIKYSNNPKYLIFRDLIGLKVQAQKKNNAGENFTDLGEVSDETYNLLITSSGCDLKTDQQTFKKYIKKNYIFRFELHTENEILIVEVDGNKILKRPENRIKLLRKKNLRR